MVISEQDLEELKANRGQRRFFSRPDLSVVICWVDKAGDIRLTRPVKGGTLSLEATAGERAGP